MDYFNLKVIAEFRLFKVQCNLNVPALQTFLKSKISAKYVHEDAFQILAPDQVVDWKAVENFDAQVTGGSRRSTWCKLWLQHPSGTGRIAINVSTREVIGFGVLRLTEANRLELMPLYANSSEIASKLILQLIGSFPKIDEVGKLCFGFFGMDNREFMEDLSTFLGLAREKRVSKVIFRTEVIKFDHIKVFAIADSAVNFV